jgi:hypothetical protein
MWMIGNAALALLYGVAALLGTPPASPAATSTPTFPLPAATAPVAAPATTPTAMPVATPLAVPPAPRPSPRRAANFMAAPRKGPGELLYGPLRYFVNTKWICKTFAGSIETHDYVRSSGYGFALHTELQTLAGQTYRLSETYSFDWAHNRWKVQLAGGAYVADSVLSNYNDLIFEGHDVEHGTPARVRMHYHMYDDVILRRDFEVYRNGYWVPSSGETCERDDFSVTSH